MNNAIKKVNIPTPTPPPHPWKKTKKRFHKGYKQIIMEILLNPVECFPTNWMVVGNLTSLSPVNMAQIPSKAHKRF